MEAPFTRDELPEYETRGYYSIPWSARASSDGGIVRPRALAVLRLRTNSNFVGCSIGRFAGLAPFRILSTYVAASPPASACLGPYESRPPAAAPPLNPSPAGSL